MLGDVICSDSPLHIEEKDGVGRAPFREGVRGKGKVEGAT